jgi:hypothetical protein
VGCIFSWCTRPCKASFNKIKDFLYRVIYAQACSRRAWTRLSQFDLSSQIEREHGIEAPGYFGQISEPVLSEHASGCHFQHLGRTRFELRYSILLLGEFEMAFNKIA